MKKMKTKTYRTTMAKIVGVVAIIFAILMIVGIIVESATEIFTIPMIGFCGMLMLIAVVLFFVENGKSVTLRANEIVLPRESRRNGREKESRMSVLFSDIVSIRLDDAIFSGTVYEMTLRNGDEIRFKFKGIGAEKEREIMEELNLRLRRR
jgi:hypothetical protein